MAIDKTFQPKKGVAIPDGSHVGLFLGLTHLGIQRKEYKGEVSYKDSVLLRFELPDLTLDDGRPITLSKIENYHVGAKANLTQLVKALNGGRDAKDGLDWEDQVGKPLLLNIELNSKGTSSNIKGYTTLPDVLKKTLKPMMNEPQLHLDVEEISAKDLESMPEWVRKVIASRVKEEGESDQDANY